MTGAQRRLLAGAAGFLVVLGVFVMGALALVRSGFSERVDTPSVASGEMMRFAADYLGAEQRVVQVTPGVSFEGCVGSDFFAEGRSVTVVAVMDDGQWKAAAVRTTVDYDSIRNIKECRAAWG